MISVQQNPNCIITLRASHFPQKYSICKRLRKISHRRAALGTLISGVPGIRVPDRPPAALAKS